MLRMGGSDAAGSKAACTFALRRSCHSPPATSDKARRAAATDCLTLCHHTAPQVPLSSALPFLEGALWGASERRRTAALARNLRRSEHISLLGQLADERQRWVLSGCLSSGVALIQLFMRGCFGPCDLAHPPAPTRLPPCAACLPLPCRRSVLLTPERNCSICYKRVGTAALVAFPTGLLAHFSCYRRVSGGGGGSGGAAGAAAVPVAAAVGSSFHSWT